jgi:hypothetical protein
MFDYNKQTKLTDFTICDCHNQLEDLVMNFRDCSITDFHFETVAHLGSCNKNIMTFIKTQEKSLKKLNHWDIYSDESDDTMFILKNIKKLRLEEFFLRSYRGDLNVLWEFLRQNESTLKSLLLGHCDLIVEMLEMVCDLLPNLEELLLGNVMDMQLKFKICSNCFWEMYVTL